MIYSDKKIIAEDIFDSVQRDCNTDLDEEDEDRSLAEAELNRRSMSERDINDICKFSFIESNIINFIRVFYCFFFPGLFSDFFS